MKGIHLLSGPRNISTAMMYAFAHRTDCRVIDEPFYAYYLARSGKDHPGREKTLRARPSDPLLIFELINDTLPEHHILFLKNMPHHMKGIDPGLFPKGLRPVFLIRHPSLMISSFSKVIPQVTLVDLALKDQVDLFDQIKESHDPIVLDAATVVRDPQTALNRLCVMLGIDFQAGMVSWTPGPIPEDGPWAEHWYAGVHASSGIAQRIEEPVEVAPKYQDLLDQALPYYNYLKEHET